MSTAGLTAGQAFEYRAQLRLHGDVCVCDECGWARQQLIGRPPEGELVDIEIVDPPDCPAPRPEPQPAEDSPGERVADRDAE